MIAQEIGPFESIEDVMVDADGHVMGHGRPAGLHLSAIVKARREARGDKMGAPAGWQEGAAMYFGFLWEWAIELAFKSIGLLRPDLVKQVRLELDGIHMTLDGLDFSADEAVLEEYKSTWRSMKWIDCGQPIEECLDEHFASYLDQIKGYLYAAGKVLDRPVTVARLFVFFVRGDYKGMGPRVRVFELRFSQEELGEHWRVVLQVAKEL